MNWTNQYLQTKYLNLISHIISQECKGKHFFVSLRTNETAMKETIERRLLWNEAAKAGLLLGLFTGIFIFANTMLPKLLTGGKGLAVLSVIISTVLWLVKFVGCLALLRYFMMNFSSKFKGVTVPVIFRFGVITALTSALIVAGINLLNLTLISSEDMQSIIDTTLQSYGSISQLSDSDRVILDRTVSHLPQISFFVTLGYCFLYGTLASRILANTILPKDEFGDIADEQ